MSYIGIDLGGTNVRAGVVTPDGQLKKWREVPIKASQGPEAGITLIIKLIEQLDAETGIHPKAIGIGSTGPVDSARGLIQNPYTLPTWDIVDIINPLREHFGVPVVLENDADAAALGESWIGAGRDLARMLMVTVGTGIGTAFIFEGKIYRGAGGVHPEGGHILVDPAGPECYCGAKGCWESLASGPAIGAYARIQSAREPSSLMERAGNDPEKIDSALVAVAACEGDPFALKIVKRTATYLGLGLASLLQIFLPDCVVFTGGVMRSYSLFEPRLREIITQHSALLPLDKIPLRMAELGQQAGFFGAARAAMLEVGTNL